MVLRRLSWEARQAQAEAAAGKRGSCGADELLLLQHCKAGFVRQGRKRWEREGRGSGGGEYRARKTAPPAPHHDTGFGLCWDGWGRWRLGKADCLVHSTHSQAWGRSAIQTSVDCYTKQGNKVLSFLDNSSSNKLCRRLTSTNKGRREWEEPKAVKDEAVAVPNRKL